VTGKNLKSIENQDSSPTAQNDRHYCTQHDKCCL